MDSGRGEVEVNIASKELVVTERSCGGVREVIVSLVVERITSGMTHKRTDNILSPKLP